MLKIGYKLDKANLGQAEKTKKLDSIYKWRDRIWESEMKPMSWAASSNVVGPSGEPLLHRLGQTRWGSRRLIGQSCHAS